MCSEQSAGILPLLALAAFVGANLELRVYIEPDCWTVMEYEYLGRDAEGRPEWEYIERRVCDEHER